MEIRIDVGQVKAFLSGSESAIDNMASSKFNAAALQQLREKARMDFYLATDAIAAGDESLGHVYEWGERGSPAGRLYSLDFISANQYVARMVYNFRESEIPVPVGGANASDTRTTQHIFYAKAWVFEEGGTVTISPQVAKALAWPVGDDMAFTSATLRVRLAPQFVGRFAEHWQQYWASGAGETSARQVAKEIDKKLGLDMNKYIESVAKSTRVRARQTVSNKPYRGRVEVKVVDEGRSVQTRKKKVPQPHFERTVSNAGFDKYGVKWDV